MIPEKIKHYFEISAQKDFGETALIEGKIICCNNHNFKILSNGEIKSSLFTLERLVSQSNSLVLDAQCEKCGRIVPVFNSDCDGYGKCDESTEVVAMKKSILRCKKCKGNHFGVSVKYEYPSEEELKQLDFINQDNAFTWIWITIKCRDCGKIYRNLINLETD